MSDTVDLDIDEKVNVLFKAALGFPSAEESRQWYEETTVPFNTYIIGENIFLDEVPSSPDFNINGKVRTASEIGLSPSMFEQYSDNINDKSTCSIVDDSTGTVRRFNLLVLEQTPELTKPYSSWYKLNNTSENIIKDALQFNYKQYTENSVLKQPYIYHYPPRCHLGNSVEIGWLISKMGYYSFPMLIILQMGLKLTPYSK
jgi:hypothetical protein